MTKTLLTIALIVTSNFAIASTTKAEGSCRIRSCNAAIFDYAQKHATPVKDYSCATVLGVITHQGKQVYFVSVVTPNRDFIPYHVEVKNVRGGNGPRSIHCNAVKASLYEM